MNVWQLFAGMLLGLSAAIILGVISLTALDRQSMVRAGTVHMGHTR